MRKATIVLSLCAASAMLLAPYAVFAASKAAPSRRRKIRALGAAPVRRANLCTTHILRIGYQPPANKGFHI